MKKSLVLSDDLLKEYYAFKHNKGGDSSDIEALLSFYKPHITNIAQLKRIGITKKPILNRLLASGRTHQTHTLLELADITKYKIILDKKRTDYPYVSISKDEIENNFSATYYKNQPRYKAREHIKALLKNAQHIFLYDKYFSNNWNSCNSYKNFFIELVPKKKLTIWYSDNHLVSIESKIKTIHKDWLIKKDSINKNHRDLHDRYIIIDSKIEIILTSGFDYLFDESKDFTYIIRDLENE